MEKKVPSVIILEPMVLVLNSDFAIPMSEIEEVLVSPMRDCITPAEYMVGAYRAEHTRLGRLVIYKWNCSKKNPPSYDRTTSWFKYEELIEDWLDAAVLDTSKQGPALKNRLRGNADKYRGLLNRDALRTK